MALTINTSFELMMGAQRYAGRAQNDLVVAMARLSSGLRINSARDDAAGLAISERFSAQLRGAGQATRNVNDGISLVQIGDSALGSITENLQRVRELAVQSANATNSAADRAALQQEVAQLVQEIDRVATQTQFNGASLLDGSFTARAFQVGANVGQAITVGQIGSARPSALGQYQGFNAVNETLDYPNTYGIAFSVTIAGTTISLGSVVPDAKAVSAAINNANIEGMTAFATATTIAAGTSASNATASGTATFTLNGVAIAIDGVSGGAALAGNRIAAVAAINAQSSATGVIATDTGSGVSLSAADGRNINGRFSSGTFTGGNGYDFGLAYSAWNGPFGPTTGTITGGRVNVDYVAPAGVTGNVVFSHGAMLGGFNSTHTIATAGPSVGAIDVSTVTGANAALRALDIALAQVNTSRTGLGAAQSRFSATLQSLASYSEDIGAARSRIVDADFAAETANLSRAQILQQSSVAMMAQANQSGRLLLSLLR